MFRWIEAELAMLKVMDANEHPLRASACNETMTYEFRIIIVMLTFRR